jgi:hypothetical protein
VGARLLAIGVLNKTGFSLICRVGSQARSHIGLLQIQDFVRQKSPESGPPQR